jgi:hypothetical protein
MSDPAQFLDEMMPRIHRAETALHNGDAGPRFEMWSHTDPVTVFGAAFSPIGWAEVGPMFEKLASNFSNCRSCEWEVVAADVGKDFAYLLAIERTPRSGTPNPRGTRSAARQSSGAKRRLEDRPSPCRSSRRVRTAARALGAYAIKATARL